MKNAHKSCEFNDNRDGTLSIRYKHAAGLSYCAVISQEPLPPGSKPPPDPHLPENEARAIRLRGNPAAQPSTLHNLEVTASNSLSESPATASLKRAMQDSAAWQHVQMWVTGGFHDGHFNDEQERIAFIQILGLPTSTLLEPSWINSFKQKLIYRAQRRFFIVLSILLRVVGVPNENGNCEACGNKEALRGCFVLPPIAQGLKELQSVVRQRCSNCILCKRGCSFTYTMNEPLPQPEHATAQLYESSPESEYASAESEGGSSQAPDPSESQRPYQTESDDGQGFYEDGSPDVDAGVAIDPHLPALNQAFRKAILPHQRNLTTYLEGQTLASAQPGSQASHSQNMPPPPAVPAPSLDQRSQILSACQTGPSRRDSSETTLRRSPSIREKGWNPVILDADELYPPVERQGSVAPRPNEDDVATQIKTISVDVFNLIHRVEKRLDKFEQANFVGRMLWLLMLDGAAGPAFDVAAALSERGLELTKEHMPSLHLKPVNAGLTQDLGMIVMVLLEGSDLGKEAGNIVASILRLPKENQDTARKMVQVLCTTLLQTPPTSWTPMAERNSNSSQEWCISFHRPSSGPDVFGASPAFIHRISIDNDHDMHGFALSETRYIDILRIREGTWRKLTSPPNRPPQRVCRILSGRLQVRQDDTDVVMDRGQMFHIGNGMECVVRSMHSNAAMLEIDYSI